MNKTISINMTLPLVIEKEDHIFVSSCPILDVFSQGYSEKEAIDNLAEAVSLFLITCFEMGTLNQVLTDCGFKPTFNKKVRPVRVPNTFDVSFPLMVNKSAPANHCHA